MGAPVCAWDTLGGDSLCSRRDESFIGKGTLL